MKTLRLKPLTFALISSFAIAQAAFAAVEPSLHEDTSISPGRSVTPADENVISSSASRVLHHIGLARNALRKKEVEQAKHELKQAETLLDIIQNTVPTTIVKNRVWTADGKLKYENMEEIPASSVPIYVTLDERAEFERVKLPGAQSSNKTDVRTEAKSNTGQETKADAKTSKNDAMKMEPEAKDAALYYEELDLPLNTTRHFIAGAQIEIAKNRITEADKALRAAQDNVDFVSIYLPDPLLAARINLERAEAHYSAGQKDKASADLSRSIAQLTAAGKLADSESQADVKQMLDEAQSLQDRMGKSVTGLEAELKSLWHRAKAHADRILESSSVGWLKLRQHDQLRGALIEAKRFVAYADIDANVTGDTKSAMHDLEQAKGWLEKAAEETAKARNGEDTAVYVKDIRAVIDTLLSGQAKPGKGEMANLKQQLAQAIARS